MAREKSSEPLYRQLYGQFRKNIADGIWRPGDLVPGEMQLCEAYQVSRITVRQAMNLLKAEGYIRRTPGKGSFISEPPMEQKLNSFYSFSDSSAPGGIPATSRVIAFDPQRPDSSLRELFGIETRDTLIRLERVRLMEGVPFAHEISYFPLQYFPGISREAVETDGLYNSFMKYGGIRPDIAEETFEATRIGAVSAGYLQVSPSGPAMHIIRIARHSSRVVEQCNTIVRGDRIRYHIVMPRQA